MVQEENGTELVVLGLGSNKGHSWRILQGAIEALQRLLHDLRISSLYRTKPQDYVQQDDFLNMAAAGRYDGSPETLLYEIQRIEQTYGRDRMNEIPKGPRFLDIDIIFFGNQSVCMTHPPLTIPHPAFKQRCFVLIPVLELYPHYRDPVSMVRLQDYYAALPEQGVIKIGPLDDTGMHGYCSRKIIKGVNSGTYS